MTLTFQTASKLHQHTYLKSRQLHLGETGLNVNGWVWRALQIVADASRHDAVEGADVLLVFATLREIAADASWIRAAAVRPSRMTLESAIRAIEAMEEAIARLPDAEHRKAIKGAELRLWLQRGLIALNVPRAERLAVQHQTRFVRRRPQPRKMISDMPTHESAEAEHPLGALPHRSAKELVDAERQKREADLARVEAAALKDLKEHEEKFMLLKERLDRYATNCTAMIEREMALAREVIPNWLRDVPPLELAAGYFQLFNDTSFWRRTHAASVKVTGATLITGYLYTELGIRVPRNRLVETFVYPMAMQDVLCACLILIQAHTGWNVNSVLEMRRNMVVGTDPRYNIQGYKRRVSQLTPIVEVSTASVGALMAIRFILKRHDWMVENGWISAEETRLWLNPSSTRNDKELRQYVGWGSCLADFCEKHSLPHFSFEQLRVQKLSLISLGAAGVRGAQETAGHLNLGTTGHYLEQEILLRLRSAMNLEFQRRLESVISYELGGEGTSEHRYLLRDIGDGASCAAPNSPPRGEELLNGECRAENCHNGLDGCPNRHIKVTEQSLEAAVRTSRFYRTNWSRIAMDNPEAFERFHLQRVVFNQALLHAVSRSPYRSKLTAIQERVRAEDA